MLGDKIKKLRESRKLTQVQLAKNIGIAQSTLGMIESNRASAGRKTLVKLSEFFNVSIDYLMSEDKTSSDDKDLEKKTTIDTIAAHLEDKELTPQKVKLLENYIDLLFAEEFNE